MADAIAKPIIILAHGAWHRPLHYLSLIEPLRSQGYTVVAPPLPTTGYDTTSLANATFADGVLAIRTAMQPYLEAGRDIVVVAHSHGGILATDSVVGETVQDRQQRGEAGGVKAMVYIAAFAPPYAGTSLAETLGMKGESGHPSWWYPKNGIVYMTDMGLQTLYGDVDKATAEIYYSGTVLQSWGSLNQPCTHSAAEIQAPKVYAACRLDMAIPYESQLAMSAAAGAEVIHLDCGHSPFIKKKETDQLVQIIVQAAEQ